MPDLLIAVFELGFGILARKLIVKTHPTLKSPRCRTFRNNAIVFSQPKHSSMRFRFL
jgi:hypothetical protein